MRAGGDRVTDEKRNDVCCVRRFEVLENNRRKIGYGRFESLKYVIASDEVLFMNR